MKKIISSIAIASILVTSSLAVDFDKAYVGAGLALESMDGFDDNGIALTLTAGVPVLEAGPGALLTEIETSFDLISPETKFFGSTLEASFFSLGAYAAYQLDINKQIFVKPRLGLIYKSISIDTGFGSVDDSEIGLAMGVQAGYKINNKLDAIVGYNMLDGADITHLSFGVQYHF